MSRLRLWSRPQSRKPWWTLQPPPPLCGYARLSRRASWTPADPAPPAQGSCYGCGAALQLSEPSAPGYVAAEKYAPKAAHRQLGQLLCARCGGLTHGRLVNAVAGQGSDTGEAARRPGLVSPEQLRAHLAALRERNVLVILLVDATDFSASFLPRLRDCVGRNPVLLVVTKADLLPRGTDELALATWIEDEVGYRRLTLAGLHLVSARRGDGMQAAVAEMCATRRGRDVVVVGAANVGKSSFIRAALASMRQRGDLAAPTRRLPVASLLPGTTLGVIPLRAFGGEGTLYDTPGVVLHHRVNGMLDGPDLAALAPRLPLQLREARAPGEEELQGCAVFWEGLARVDVLQAPRGTRLLFWGPSERARVAALPLDRAEAGETPWAGAEGGDGVGTAAVAARGGLRVARELELAAGLRLAPIADVVVSGMGGWMTVVAGGGGRGGVATGPPLVKLRVWAPKGAEIFIRPPMPVQPKGSW